MTSARAGGGGGGSAVVAADISIERAVAMTVTFEDGEVAVFPVLELRGACPCAGCRGDRERGEPAWPKPHRPATVEIVDARLVGAWGISLRWSDGHDIGIYSWAVLRRWWDGGFRHPLVEDPAPGPPEAPSVD